MQFDGKCVLITGAASGMGAACARLFAAAGAQLVIVDQNAAAAGAVAAETGAGAPLIGDVADSAFCDAAVARALDRHGRLDVLVNAAGIIRRTGVLDTGDDDWARVLAVNLGGTFFMARAALRAMLPKRAGAIVNFGSIWGEVGAAGVAAYCASKGAVHQLTRALALEHATDGIRVNAVCPGEVNTPMLASERAAPPAPADLQRLADATIPMKRLAEPDEIAGVVLFLASDAASYMTGALVPVDAGYTAR